MPGAARVASRLLPFVLAFCVVVPRSVVAESAVLATDPSLSAPLAAREPAERVESTETNARAPGRYIHARYLGDWDTYRRGAFWCAFAGILLVVVGSRLKAVRGGADRRWLLSLLALTVVAIGVRSFVPPWAPMHANNHGIAELRGLSLERGTYSWGPVETDRYGFAHRQVVRSVVGLWGGGYRSALGFGAVVGGLSVLAMAVFVAALTGERIAGGLAALLLALHPAHVALSPTESPQPLAMLLWLVGLWAFVVAREERHPRLYLWLSALALSCALELNIPSLVIAPASLLFFAALWLRRKGPALLDSLLPGYLVAVAFAFHVTSLWPVLDDALHMRGDGASAALKRLLFSEADILVDPLLTSVLVPVLMSVGALVLASQRAWGLLASLLLVYVLPLVPAASVAACRTDWIRYQTLAQVGALALAGHAFVAVPTWSLRPLFPALLASIIVATSVPGLVDVARRSLGAQAFAVAEAAVRHSEGRLNVLLPRFERIVIPDFPDFIAPSRVRVQAWDRASEAVLASCHVWVGPSCYSFPLPERDPRAFEEGSEWEGALMRSECRPLVELIDEKTQPLAAQRVEVTHRKQEFHVIPAETVLVGLFPCRSPHRTNAGDLSVTGPG